MIILPVGRSPDWRKPPVITLLLIVINCLIFFGLQARDEKREDKALAYYGSTNLAQTELPRYTADLIARGKKKEAEALQKAQAKGRWGLVLFTMQHDKDFMKRLRAGEVITPDLPDYVLWRTQRDHFDRLMGKGMVERFGFVPAEPTLSGAIGHMFLHGDFGHLLGNMVFLFIVGYMVEEALGKRRFLAFYLLSGLGGVLMDLLVNASRTVPGIGASGAVSGVMAMFVVIYGLQRIRFFYWIVFYFDFFRAPAIAILPFWIGNELYQFFFNHGSHVNYMAHFGGFVAGAALVALQQRYGKKPLHKPEIEKPVDTLPADMVRIEKLLGELRVDEALKALRTLAGQHPHNPEVIRRYYRVARNNPASADFHRAAALVFAYPDPDTGHAALLYEVFREYLNTAKPHARFTNEQLAMLVRKLGRGGYLDDAERLIRILMRRDPQAADIRELVHFVAACFSARDDRQRKQNLLALIAE